jgi:hypothetical protein
MRGGGESSYRRAAVECGEGREERALPARSSSCRDNRTERSCSPQHRQSCRRITAHSTAVRRALAVTLRLWLPLPPLRDC